MICPVCQTEFIKAPNAPRHTYCSRQCFAWAWRERNPNYQGRPDRNAGVLAGVDAWIAQRFG